MAWLKAKAGSSVTVNQKLKAVKLYSEIDAPAATGGQLLLKGTS